MKSKLTVLFCFWLMLPLSGYGWNAVGHCLIAQIASNHLTKHAQKIYSYYNNAVEQPTYRYRRPNLIVAAAWLDRPKLHKLKAKHYINLPFSSDGTKLKAPRKNNAVTAVNQAVYVMQNANMSDLQHGMAVRILLHVVADLHQPLHAVSKFSATHPAGDQGGNLFPLGPNAVARNLHAYWDRAGGFLQGMRCYDRYKLSQQAQIIEQRWPCHGSQSSAHSTNIDPRIWAEESHWIAVKKAYHIQPGQRPSQAYQKMAQEISKKRIALAGCRLAALLNTLAQPKRNLP